MDIIKAIQRPRFLALKEPVEDILEGKFPILVKAPALSWSGINKAAQAPFKGFLKKKNYKPTPFGPFPGRTRLLDGDYLNGNWQYDHYFGWKSKFIIFAHPSFVMYEIHNQGLNLNKYSYGHMS